MGADALPTLRRKRASHGPHDEVEPAIGCSADPGSQTRVMGGPGFRMLGRAGSASRFTSQYFRNSVRSMVNPWPVARLTHASAFSLLPHVVPARVTLCP